MFKRMLSAFGIGGPSVDTVLDSPHAVPGQAITGQVRIQGGSADAEISQVVLSVVTRAEADHDDHEHGGTPEFFRLVVRVPANQLVSIPFQLVLPWETPITAVGGTALPGMSVGVRTELLVSGAPTRATSTRCWPECRTSSASTRSSSSSRWRSSRGGSTRSS